MKTFISSLLLFLSIGAFAQEGLWQQLLDKHVNDKGEVDYEGMYQDQSTLSLYLTHLADNPPNPENQHESIAYWVNLYNASTIQLMSKAIVEDYAVSISLLDGAFEEPFIRSGEAFYSLSQIENSVLKNPSIFDSRIHFALVCASLSCPDLRNEAYNAQNLESQLEQETAKFINDQSKNYLGADSAELSYIFKWYEEDFSAQGGVISFINRYAEKAITSEVAISYLKYDWNLNYQ